MIFQVALLLIALIAGFIYLAMTQGFAFACGVLAVVCLFLFVLSLV